MSKKFIWVRKPSGTTTYVDYRGDDANGDGTAQNPYQTILKATTVAASGSNIMLGYGLWNGSRYSTKIFNFYGNSKTLLGIPIGINTGSFSFFNGDSFSNLILNRLYKGEKGYYPVILSLNNCIVFSIIDQGISSAKGYAIKATDCIFSSTTISESPYTPQYFKNCIFYDCIFSLYSSYNNHYFYNSIFISGTAPSSVLMGSSNNNWTNNNIPTNSIASINNSATGQTLTDYFNNYDADVLKADFTAKAGSSNIGAGENGTNIGLNEGYPARATNDSSDIFSEANGATVRNVVWSSALNGYVIAQKDKVCLGSTTDTITLAADAEATDDYYNGLFIGITAGNGYGEIHRITDYDGTTKVATIDGNWTTQPDTQSVYSITGSIVSATKDYGKLIRIKQNWAFCANMESWTKTNNDAYGMWKEFITTPLLNNGVWELRPCSNFRYEYSLNGTDWYSNTELIAGTDTDNKTDGDTYGNASENYTSVVARATRLRYARFHIEIGFNIGEDVA